MQMENDFWTFAGCVAGSSSVGENLSINCHKIQSSYQVVSTSGKDNEEVVDLTLVAKSVVRFCRSKSPIEMANCSVVAEIRTLVGEYAESGNNHGRKVFKKAHGLMACRKWVGLPPKKHGLGLAIC